MYCQAKTRKLNLWKGHTPKATQSTSSFDAVVLKVVNGDTIEVGPKQESGRRTIQFSSVRQPKYIPTHAYSHLGQPIRNRQAGKQRLRNISENVSWGNRFDLELRMLISRSTFKLIIRNLPLKDLKLEMLLLLL